MTRDLIRVPEGKCYACASCHVPLASKAALISKVLRRYARPAVRCYSDAFFTDMAEPTHYLRYLLVATYLSISACSNFKGATAAHICFLERECAGCSAARSCRDPPPPSASLLLYLSLPHSLTTITPIPLRSPPPRLPRLLCSDNVRYGPAEDRMLMTGMHRVADVLCGVCGGPLGWTYYEAFEESQRYKEGKVILEKAKLCKKG